MVADPELREELLDRVERELAVAERFDEAVAVDASLRRELDERMAGPTATLAPALAAWEDAPPVARELLAINAENADWLAARIADEGWPALRSVGADGVDAAWMLAINADRLADARAAWLEPLAAAVASGDADPRHLATLADRVAAVSGAPQEYGTIALVAADGEIEHPLPVRDPARLDERRLAIGLPPMAAEAPHLADGELVPYGPQRGATPIGQWPIVLEGHVSAEAALEAGVRHVHRVWATRPGDRRLGRLRALARERGVTIDQVDPVAIEAVAQGRSHGGVIALVAPRREQTFDRLIGEVGEGSLVVMLDGIEDPFNHGQAVRALYAAGVDALVERRSWETAAGTVTRASAGTTELLPTAVVASAEDAAATCRRAGMRVAVTVSGGDDAVDLHEADLNGGVFVLIGGERRGVTRSFVEQADVRIRIGYGRSEAPALGAATAAALIGFEALRQRRMAPEPGG